MITYPLTAPSSPGFQTLTWSPMSAVASQESPFTYQKKVYAWAGQKRLATIDLPTMTLTQAKAWQAFIYSLNGIEGTFYLHDSVGKNLQGAASGSGLVNGASQTGQDLNTDGWAAGVTGLFKAGDWISIADRLYTVLADVNSNGSGQATLTLWPDVHAPADNAAILYGANARGTFRLVDWPEFTWDLSRYMSGFSLSAEEVVP